jgi:hypothetical protein
MAAHHRTWWAVAAAALIASACHDTSAPQPKLANPQQLTSDLQTVDSVFQSPAFQSFTSLDSAPGSPVQVSAPAGALLRAAWIAAPGSLSEPYAAAPARLQAIKLAAAALSSTATAGVIPPTLQGKTFVWNATTSHYVVDSTATPAAPANGVRIILYAIDPLTRRPAGNPPIAVGYVDLLDQSAGSTNQLQVGIAGGTAGSPGTTYVHYTISGTVTGAPPTAFNASATGYVTDGTRRLTFNVTFAATNLNAATPDGQFDATWVLDNPAVSVTAHESAVSPDANHGTITVDFSVTHGSETVRLAGTLSFVISPQTLTIDLTVYVNGQVFARITGTVTSNSSTVQVLHADGTTLSTDELNALGALNSLPDRLTVATDHLFHPAQHLMGA